MPIVYPEYQEILVNIKDNVALITLNRPKFLNSFTGIMALELIDAYNRLDLDPDVKVVVLTGSGQAFCAGADLRGGSFAAGEAKSYTLTNFRDGGGQVTLAIHRCRKVCIAAMNGSAVGIGITVTLPMDIRIVWKDAKVGFVFVRRGIVPEAASSFFLPQLIGKSRTLALFAMGKVLPASHHLYDGLWTEVIDSQDKVLPTAMALAQDIAKNTSVISTALTKALVWHPASTPQGQHLLDSKAIFYTRAGKDAQEGVTAFLKKRDTNFPGRIGEDFKGYTIPDFYPWWTQEEVSGEDFPAWTKEYLEHLKAVYKAHL